jgi:large subunit ribosomal protein L32
MPNPSKCPNCNVAKLPHRVCSGCGFYNGEFVVISKNVKKSDEAQQQGLVKK